MHETAMTRRFTASIEREDETYLALCPELDIASQGEPVAEARDNLREAIELFSQTASQSEIGNRLHNENYLRQVTFSYGQATL